MSIEAMKQALEVLKADSMTDEQYGKTITDLEQAIATEESSATQKPVAWMTTEVTTGTQVWLYEKTAARYQNPPTPLYTHPQPKAEQEPKREPLTDEQRMAEYLGTDVETYRKFKKWLETGFKDDAHGIKGEA